MAGTLHESIEEEPTKQAVSNNANSFIATVYFKQAKALLDRGQYVEAETYFREVLGIWPDHASSWNNLGTAVWWQDRLDEAEDYYRHARPSGPMSSQF